MATQFSSISTPTLLLPLLCFAIFYFLHTTSAQSTTPNSPICNGILLTYTSQPGIEIPPFISPADPTNQPYRFESNLTVLNNGPVELKNWRVFVGFNRGELLVSANNAVLANGTALLEIRDQHEVIFNLLQHALPANVSGGAVLSGSPATDLKTAIETAGDVDQMRAVVDLVGTQFGVAPPSVPLPENLFLANDGYLCPNLTTQGNNSMRVCCTQDPKAKTNISIPGDFSPLQFGDLTIMYDVTMTYESNYWAQVTISNNNPFGRIENWNLSWDWTQGEFIAAMRGAYPKTIDTTGCIFGSQGQFYKDFDFSKALTCERRPTIIDLPLSKTNDTALGMVPFCCRNGSILSPAMDPTKSRSAFLMQVYKMPPDLNTTILSPPLNWRINSTIGQSYQCSQPIRVNPTPFPDPSGLPTQTSAVTTWQVVCNITTIQTKKPSCCVSFSSFYNDSIVPCNTCACGCESDPVNRNNVCSATEPAMLLPAQALLVPFENRTELAETFANLKRRDIPNPLPCGDNCGVNINWHVLSDFKNGWTARVTLFNWGDNDIADWYNAIELDRAIAGFEEVYSMDGKVLTGSHNNTFFLQGFSGLNYLSAERNGSNPRKDPRVPGSQQSVISFTKKKLPEIHVARGDGFPMKVYFNGEVCSIPTTIPSNACRVNVAFSCILSMLLILLLKP